MIIGKAVPLSRHTAKPHSDPRVERVKQFTSGKEIGGKVLSRSPDDSVELFNSVAIEMEFPGGQFPNLVVELLHRLWPHAARTAGKGKTEDGISLGQGGQFRFLPAQLESEPAIPYRLHPSPWLFGRFWSSGENHEIVGITNKAKADAVQLPIQVVQNKGGQPWGYYPTRRSANGGGFEDPNRFDETPLSPNDSAAQPN